MIREIHVRNAVAGMTIYKDGARYPIIKVTQDPKHHATKIENLYGTSVHIWETATPPGRTHTLTIIED